jgi:prevent-host-death family protein
MLEVGTFAAKTHLTQLLDRVAQGEQVMITRRGKPIAMLVPPTTKAKKNVAGLVQEMLAHRDQQGPRLGGDVTIRQLIEEGRRG